MLLLSLLLPACTAQQWILNNNSNIEYYFGSELVVYDEAVTTCSNMNADLVVINDQTIQKFLQEIIRQLSMKNISKNFNNVIKEPNIQY